MTPSSAPEGITGTAQTREFLSTGTMSASKGVSPAFKVEAFPREAGTSNG